MKILGTFCIIEIITLNIVNLNYINISYDLLIGVISPTHFYFNEKNEQVTFILIKRIKKSLNCHCGQLFFFFFFFLNHFYHFDLF